MITHQLVDWNDISRGELHKWHEYEERIYVWCLNNLSYIRWHDGEFWFDNESDYTMFLLRWV